MIQFKNYPIWVNDSDLNDELQKRYAAAMAQKDGYRKAQELLNKDSYLMEIQKIPPAEQSASSRAYELWVIKNLESLLTSEIGRLLFDSFSHNQKNKIYIVPNSQLTPTARPYNYDYIYTFKNPPYQGGGIRIHINMYRDEAMTQETQPNILLHELVHAYRYGLGIDMQSSPFVVSWGGDREEVFAMIMQNIYISEIRDPGVYYSYIPTRMTKPDDAYQKLGADPFSLDVLKYFLINDPLTKKVLQSKGSAYNPWRDYAEIFGTILQRNQKIY